MVKAVTRFETKDGATYPTVEEANLHEAIANAKGLDVRFSAVERRKFREILMLLISLGWTITPPQ